jgi:hypothetical protein
MTAHHEACQSGAISGVVVSGNVFDITLIMSQKLRHVLCTQQHQDLTASRQVPSWQSLAHSTTGPLVQQSRPEARRAATTTQQHAFIGMSMMHSLIGWSVGMKAADRERCVSPTRLSICIALSVKLSHGGQAETSSASTSEADHAPWMWVTTSLGISGWRYNVSSRSMRAPLNRGCPVMTVIGQAVWASAPLPLLTTAETTRYRMCRLGMPPTVSLQCFIHQFSTSSSTAQARCVVAAEFTGIRSKRQARNDFR